jgi:hypothetical protein
MTEAKRTDARSVALYVADEGDPIRVHGDTGISARSRSSPVTTNSTSGGTPQEESVVLGWRGCRASSRDRQ